MHVAIYFCVMDLAGLEVRTRGQGEQGYFCRVADITYTDDDQGQRGCWFVPLLAAGCWLLAVRNLGQRADTCPKPTSARIVYLRSSVAIV